MTTDLCMLTASSALCALLFIPYGIAQSLVWGVSVSVGKCELTPPRPVWSESGFRAHRSMLENFPRFAALVIVVHLTEAFNEVTALGASIFFSARVVHAVVYIAGVPVVRTVALVSTSHG